MSNRASARAVPPDATLHRTLVNERVLESAAAVFAAKGVTRARMQDIADDLGISRTLLYHYYPDKEHIVRQLLLVAADEAIAQLREVVALDEPADPAGKVRLLAERLVLDFTASPGRVRFIEAATYQLPGLADPTLLARNATYFREFEALLTRGVECGQFVPMDVRVMSRSVGGMIQSTRLWYQPSGELSREEIARMVAGLVVNALRVAPHADVDLTDVRKALARLTDEVTRLSTAPRPAPRRRRA